MTLTDEEAGAQVERELWQSTGRWRGVRLGAVAAGTFCIAASWLLRRSSNPLRHAALVGTAAALLSLWGYSVRQGPWTEARVAEELQHIHRTTWPNAPPRGTTLHRQLFLRELRARSSAPGILIAGFGISLLFPAAAWVQSRKLSHIKDQPDAAAAFAAWRNRPLFCSFCIFLFSTSFLLGELSGSQDIHFNDQARRTLAVLFDAQRQYQTRDADANGIQDWWVADISGLHRRIIQGKKLGLIGEYPAQVDGAPWKVEAGKIQLAPMDFPSLGGYHFAVIPRAADGSPYGEDLDGDGQPVESRRGFAYSAYWKLGTGSSQRIHATDPSGLAGFIEGVVIPEGSEDTLIMDQTGEVWRKDTGNTRVLQWPKDPAAEGWIRWVDGLRRPPTYMQTLDQHR